MTVSSSYQPFLIGGGLSKTGYTSYLDSWQKMEDAFDTLINAYVYRGSIYQRSGFVPYPSLTGIGALVYQNNQLLASGNGAKSYSVTLSAFPVLKNTVALVATTAGGTDQGALDSGVTFTPPWTSNAQNNLSGALLNNALQNTINYTTGQVVIHTVSNVAAGIPIMIQYNYVPVALTTPVNNPIMGITQHQDPGTNTTKLVVLDTRRLSWWSTATKSFTPVQIFSQIFWSSNSNAAITTTGAITLQFTNLAPYSVSITDGTSTITDIPNNDSGVTGVFSIQGNLNPANTSTINYVTGVVTLTLTSVANSTTVYTISSLLQGDYFTGNNTNFFNFANWQTTDDQPAYLYMTNNVDNITLFDGTNLARPPFAITQAHMVKDNVTSGMLYPFQNDIKTTLDVKVYKNRLLLLRPTLIGDSPDPQSIRWSALVNSALGLNNFNFVDDVAGNGDELSAPTGDWLQNAQFFRDVIIVFFQNSTWLFRFTGNVSDLFRFDQVNSSRATNAPYGGIEYDERCTSMGAKGLIYCDGVSVNRYDVKVIDFMTTINQKSFGQCFGKKFDTLNQSWMLYPSIELNLTTSDSVVVYNFLEDTWAIYQPNLGKLVQTPTKINTLSCLGIGTTTEDVTWADFAVGSGSTVAGLDWSESVFPWNNNLLQNLSPELLAGDQNGFVYTCNDGPVDNQATATGVTPFGIPTKILTKRLNPFLPEIAQKVRFGYLDVYYEINNDVTITLNFYANGSEDPLVTKLFNLSGEPGSEWAWQRFYINTVAQFIQVEFNSEVNGVFNTAGVFKILGMILWATPAGRLTPGGFI